MTFVLSYLCELFGIGCYCSVSDDRVLTLRLVLNKDRISKSIYVKHEYVFDSTTIDDALDLIRFTGGEGFVP